MTERIGIVTGRGDSPTNFNRALRSMFGAEAVERIAAGDYGKMVAFQGSTISSVKISEAIGRLKSAQPNGALPCRKFSAVPMAGIRRSGKI